MRISIKDVAERAGVSRGTVSHVLNGNAEARIGAETRERVRQAAAELGYIPNEMARFLFRGKTRLIGVLVTGIENPFFTELIGATETAIAEIGYRRLVDASIPYVARARPELLSVWPVDGILMHAAIGRVSEGILGAPVSHVPVVYLDSPADAHRDTVQFDVRPAMAAAVADVLARGHRRIGVVGPYEAFDLTMKQRYQTLYAAAGPVGATITHSTTEDSRRAALEAGLRIAAQPERERPTALFCHNDHLAIGVYHGLRRAGLRVPEDVAVVGVDGITEGDCLDRPLTTIRNPVEELCRIGVHMLRDRIEQGIEMPPRHVTVPSAYLPKATT